MKQRNRTLRAAEILIILAYIIVFIFVEQKVVATWFSTSMSKALEKIDAVIKEDTENAVNDLKQEDQSEQQIVRFAAYYLNNDAYETDTAASLGKICESFDAWGAYIIDHSGNVITGYGVFSKGQLFKGANFDSIRNVTEKAPVSKMVDSYDLAEEYDPETDSYSTFQSCYLDEERILVLHRKHPQHFLNEDEAQLRNRNAVFSRRVFGSEGIFFWTIGEERELSLLTQENEDAHWEIEGTTVPEEARRNNYSGFITLGGKRYYCCTRFSETYSMYFYCAVPAVAIYYTTGFVAISELIVVLFFILLTRMYTRLILPEVVKHAKNIEIRKKYRRNLSILLLTAVIATLTVNIFSTTLYLFTEQIQTNSDRSEQLADMLDKFEEKQQASSIAYQTYVSIITRAAASLIPQNPDFVNTAKLEELAQTISAARVLLYDNSATVYASNRNYKGLSLSNDPQSMTYQFRWVLRGEPLLIQDKPDEAYLNRPYRFSGAPMMDEAGNYIGMVQLAMEPSIFDRMESVISMESVLTAFAPEENSVVLAVSVGTGDVVSSKREYSGKTLEALGIPQEILQDEFNGYFIFERERVNGICHDCEEYHAIVISPTREIPSRGFRYGLLTAIPGILAEILFHLILLGYVKSYLSIDEGEARYVARISKKEEREAGEEMQDFAYRFLVGLAGFVSLIFVFRNVLFEKGSLEYYIFVNDWAKGLHIFSITRCLIYIALAFFVQTTVSMLFGALATLLMSRQETFIRMGLSFFKYGVGIATVCICASTLGVPTASLLASAGVLSVMLSFGAQSIVADIISGLFIVFEGTFKVGDMITVDGWHGQVEEIGIRNTRMRDLISEDVKIMNNSTIKTIINYSERPCWCAIKVGVDYDTDIQRLEAIFHQEKAMMKKNIPLGIGEIIYLGIDELSESQMTIKFQVLCRNQDQLKVKRALNREVRLMFARNAITIPFPQVTLSTRKDDGGDDSKAT